MEISKLLRTIVYYYDLITKNPKNPWNVSETWFTSQYDFVWFVKKREL